MSLMKRSRIYDPVGSLRVALSLAIGLALHGWSAGPSMAQAGKPEAKLAVVRLRTEYKENPLGIDVRKPRLSWQLQAPGRGVVQSAYQIRVARSAGGLGGGSDQVWDSGRVASDESTQRAYDGQPLRSGQRYHWQVRVWDGGGKPSDWTFSTPPTGRRAGSSPTCPKTSRRRGLRRCSATSSRPRAASSGRGPT